MGRPFDSIERTVTLDGVIRDDPAVALQWWAEIARIHGLEGQRRLGRDGARSERLRAAGDGRGLPQGYEAVGIGEVIFVFRAPFDLETIGRLAELRAALKSG